MKRERRLVLVVDAVPDNVEILARRRDGLEALQKVHQPLSRNGRSEH